MMRVTVKEKDKSSKLVTIKHIRKNEGLYYNEDYDFYVLSVPPSMESGDTKNALIYIDSGNGVEVLNSGEWDGRVFSKTSDSIMIGNY